MDESTETSVPLTGAIKKLLHRIMAIGENRVQLLVVEVEQERNRLLDMVFMAVGTAALGMLAIVAWSAALVVLFWDKSPGLTLVILGGFYGLGAVLLCRRLMILRGRHPTFSATAEQFRKDRECLKRN